MSALAVFSVFGVCAPAAFAVFPGENGKIAFTTEFSSGFGCGDCDATGHTAWVAARGKQPARLAPTWWASRIAFSPAGTHILYQDRQGAIAIVRPDGSGGRRLSDPRALSSAWSPLGDSVAYTDSSGVVLVGVDGEGRRLVFPGAGVVDVAWSPAGTRLAFAQYEPYHPKGPLIRVIRSDGQAPQNLGRGYGLDWSASGWLSYRRGTSLVAVRPGQDQEKVVLVRGLNPVYSETQDYSWSPDGRHVAFSDNDRLWVQRLAGGARRPLTRRSFGILGWSPDGRLVAYQRDKGIYAVPARGGRSWLLARFPDRRSSHEYATAFDWQARPRQ